MYFVQVLTSIVCKIVHLCKVICRNRCRKHKIISQDFYYQNIFSAWVIVWKLGVVLTFQNRSENYYKYLDCNLGDQIEYNFLFHFWNFILIFRPNVQWNRKKCSRTRPAFEGCKRMLHKVFQKGNSILILQYKLRVLGWPIDTI